MRYLDVVLADQPIGVWPLDEPAGIVAKGYGPVGDAAYAASGQVFGEYGPGGQIIRSVATDGAAGVVILPSLSGWLGTAQPQTFEAWLRFATDINSATVGPIRALGSNTGSTNPMILGAFTADLANEVVTLTNDAAGAADSTGFTGFTIYAGWHHHALTYDGTQNSWTYHLDGASIGTKVSFSGGCFGFAGTHIFTFARTGGSSYGAIPGIAFPAIYNRRLSPAAIAAHALAGRSGLHLPNRGRLR